MRKFYSFVLLAATLLLSTSIWAANSGTASLNGAAATSIDEAITAWATNGGTLTLSSDCEYNATATTTLSKDAVLDLNGHILTWNAAFGSAAQTGALSAIVVSQGTLTIQAASNDDNTQKGQLLLNVSHDCSTDLCALQVDEATLVATDGVNIVGKFTTAPKYTAYLDDGSPKTQTLLSSRIIDIVSGAADIQNMSIHMQGECSTALNIGKEAKEVTCKKNTIVYDAGDATKCFQYITGLDIYKPNFVSEDNRVDLSNASGTYVNAGTALNAYVYALYLHADGLTITGSNSLYKVNDEKVKANRSLHVLSGVVYVEDGTFDGKFSILKVGSSFSGGKFRYSFDTRMLAPDSYLELETPYFVIKHGKSYVVRIDDKDYLNTDTWEDVCSKSSNTYTAVQIIARTDFAIPQGVFINLNFTRVSDAVSYAGMTITNNGTALLNRYWQQGSFVNNGTLEIVNSWAMQIGESEGRPMKIVNNSTGIFTIATKGSSSVITFGDYFTLDNTAGGQVSVSYGRFTDKAYEQIYKEGEYNYIATGYIGTKQGDGYWHVIPTADIIATVGSAQYDNLYDAINASSLATPAILQKDYTHLSGMYMANFGECALDLNGHTLTLDYDAAQKVQEFITIKNTQLTIQGNGTIRGIGNKGDIIFSMVGSTDPTAANYSVLNVGSGVTIEQGEGHYYAVAAANITKFYGIVVKFDGKFRGLCPFHLNGQIASTTGNVPEFNIGKTADFVCGDAIAYAAGYGIWNYAGTATTEKFGFEIRAGKLNMTGGSITCTATEPADDQYNGNGSTSQACGIAVCQHNTKLPIEVVVNDGEIKAYTPLYQANPQNNETEMSAINLTVNGGKFFSTSQNIVWSLNKRITLNGGVYNLSPAAYVASGKAVVDNTDADTKAQYPYAIGAKATAMTTVKAGAWNEAATWSAEAGATAIPTAATPVVIKHAVTVPAATKAQTDGITVEGGNITVEGALIVGNAGITGITAADQLLIKDGASMVISPAAPAGNSQPLATVELKTVIRDVKNEYQAGDRTYEYIWQNIGVPVTPMTITPAKTLTVNTWDIVSAWVPATEFGTPFLGYHVTNVDNKTAGMIYTFAGKLVGPQNAALSMPRDGFHFFGNSWTAPFDVKEILNQLQSKSASDDINSAVYVYISDKLIVDKVTYNDGQYVDINLAKLEDAATAEAFGQIAAMQGFFLHSDAKADIALNYEKAVWNAALAKPQPTKKPASMMEEENTAVRLILTAENGRSDVLYLYEGEAYAAPKMMNTKPNVNIYAITADGNYSTMGVDKIEGSKIGIQTNAKTNYTISFDWLKGETLYLKDKTANKYVAMLEDATYSFTAEANATIDDRFEIVGKSDVPGTGTTVEDVNVDVEATGIYTLMGQYVGETSMWNTLPAGMYIVNGKKCVK